MSSPTKPTSIDDLPWEMINELFDYLHLKDLAACSMVSKRWYSIYAGFKVHRLAVIDADGFYDIGSWSYPTRRIEDHQRCLPEMYRRLADQPLLSNLKHLAVCGYLPQFDLDKLNGFRQLVHLEINIEQLGAEMVDLNLPLLRVLVFNQCNVNWLLSIDCPKLSVLVYDEDNEGESLLDVKHPETIRKLETPMFGPKLAPFKGVKCLVTPQFEVISKATLLSLPRLKKLHYNASIEQFVRNFVNGPDALDRIKRALREFVGAAKVLRGSDFKFSFTDFQLTETNVNEFDFGEQVKGRSVTVYDEYIYMKNYQLIASDARIFLFTIDYNRLISGLTGEFPACFFKKFPFIQSVNALGVVQDENHFLWFLNSLSSLEFLNLEGTQLSQEFYDRLPASAHSLTDLRLTEDRKQQLSFNFIDKFPCLSKLQINVTLINSGTSKYFEPLSSP